jgi:hypothetical protein
VSVADTLTATLAALGSPPSQRDGIVRRITALVEGGLHLAEAIERAAATYALPREVRQILGHVALSEPVVELAEDRRRPRPRGARAQPDRSWR